MKKAKSKSKVMRMLLAASLACVLSVGFGLPGLSASAAVPKSDMEEAGGRYVADYPSVEEAHEAGRKLNIEIMEESITMLKNENQTLPFGKDIKNISVFGKHSVDFSYISRSNPRQTMDTKYLSLQDSLKEAGFNVNPILEDFYRHYEYKEFTFNHPEFETAKELIAMKANNRPYTKSRTIQNPIKVSADQHKKSVLQPAIAEFDDYNLSSSMDRYSDAALIVLGNRGSSNFLYSRGWNDSPTINSENDIEATLATYSHPNDYYNHIFQLTQSERDLIEYVGERFDNVVVLINSAESWDIPELKEYECVDSVLHMAVPGTDGIMALGKILNGEVNPSGRTVNMHLVDTTKSPQWQNQGTNSHLSATATPAITFTNDNFAEVTLEENTEQNIYQEYEEGIYIGSKYFETRGWEMGGNKGTADYAVNNVKMPYANGDWTWYDANVVYPLGHGLSYTEFEWELVDASHSNGAVLKKDDVVTIDVKVTNVGNVAGKDVVELYYTAPYTPGGVEKAFVNLAGFEKTKILNPGQSQVLSFELRAQDMSSYDWNNASGMGKNTIGTWGQYILDEGDYQIRLMRNSNVRSEQVRIDVEVPAGGYAYDKDKDSGNQVENHFSVNDEETGAAIGLTEGLKKGDAVRHQKGIYNTFGDFTTVFTRAQFNQTDDWLFGEKRDPASTFPTPPDEKTRVASDEMYKQLTTVFNPTDTKEGDVATRPWVADFTEAGGVPKDWTQAADTTGKITIMAKEMAGVPFDNAKWDNFLNQLTLSELYDGQIANGSYGSGSNERVGLPRGGAPDGAHGLQGAAGDNGTTGQVAAGRGTVHPEPTAITMTWNKELMYRNGRQMGTEARLSKMNDLYTLTFDLRRQHYEARSWEGCSEDPFLLGTRGMYYVLGSQDAGTIVQVKHFAMFNGGVKAASPTSKLITEQALRELYLEPFRMATTPNGGGAMGVMTSYNRVGITSTCTNYSLITAVLKNEWGFSGFVCTDMQGSNATSNYNNAHLQLRAGVDQYMGSRDAKASPIWDAKLRDGKGSVRLTDVEATSNFAGITGTPQSDIEYYIVRNAAKRCIYAGVNSAVFSYSEYLYKDAISAWGTQGEISAVQNIKPNIDLSLQNAAELLPEGSIVRYRLAAGSTLPLGTEMTPNGLLRQSTAGGGDRLDTINDDTASGAVLRESSTKPFTFVVEMLVDNEVHAKKTFALTMNSAFQIGTYDPESTEARPEISNAVNMSTPYTNLKVGEAFTGRIEGVAPTQFYQEDAEVSWQNSQGSGRNTVYTVDSGSFPAGLTLASDGTVTGTPIAAGQYDFTIKAHRMIRTIVRDAIKVENLIYYIHATMIVSPEMNKTDVEGWIDAALKGTVNEDVIKGIIDANANGFLTETSVQSIINASISGSLNETTIKGIVDTAVADKLTEAETQALIDKAIAANKESGCSGSVMSTYGYILSFVVLGVAVMFIIKRKNLANK